MKSKLKKKKQPADNLEGFDPERLCNRMIDNRITPPPEFISVEEVKYYPVENDSSGATQYNYYIASTSDPAAVLYGRLGSDKTYKWPQTETVEKNKAAYRSKFKVLREKRDESLTSTGAKIIEDSIVKWLATLSILDYDRARKKSADKMGVSLSGLDKAVEQARKRSATASFKTKAGHAVAQQQVLKFGA